MDVGFEPLRDGPAEQRPRSATGTENRGQASAPTRCRCGPQGTFFTARRALGRRGNLDPVTSCNTARSAPRAPRGGQRPWLLWLTLGASIACADGAATTLDATSGGDMSPRRAMARTTLDSPRRRLRSTPSIAVTAPAAINHATPGTPTVCDDFERCCRLLGGLCQAACTRRRHGHERDQRIDDCGRCERDDDRSWDAATWVVHFFAQCRDAAVARVRDEHQRRRVEEAGRAATFSVAGKKGARVTGNPGDRRGQSEPDEPGEREERQRDDDGVGSVRAHRGGAQGARTPPWLPDPPQAALRRNSIAPTALQHDAMRH